MTVVSATVPGQSTSLIEMGAQGIARFAARRRAARAGRPGALSFLGELSGTLAALTCFVVAAFLVTLALGLAVAGVALLLLDFKITVIRRARAAQHPRGSR